MLESLISHTGDYFRGKARSCLGARRFEEVIAQVELLDFSQDDLRENEKTLNRFRELPSLHVHSVNWFVPYFDRAFAGIRTILRFADYFQRKKGVENRLIIYDEPGADLETVKARVVSAFPELQNFRVIILRNSDVDALPACDVTIATSWTSAYPVLKFKMTKGKFYFIQDYEPLFNPAGSLYALAEATYRFGFYAIINTPGLWDFYRSQFSTPSTFFKPAVDSHVFYPSSSRKIDGKFRLFFYGRPEVPRNAYEIGVLAIRRLKQKWGDRLQVYVAGSPNLISPRSYNGALFHNLGFMPYAETANLYRKCDAGLILMLTKHPSYIPLELMGCGVAVISNVNSVNSWLLRDGENCLLSEPSVSCIADKVSILISNPPLARKLSTNGVETVSELSWNEGMERVFNFVCRRDPI